MYVTHSSANGLEVTADSTESAIDPNANLFGDWSWKPDRYPEDPGYVYDAEDLTLFNAGSPLVIPWSVPAYAGIEERPQRIGPCVG